MALELNNIYKSFGEKQVLTGISLKAKSGEAFGLLGRNGAGKTTTIRMQTAAKYLLTGNRLITAR